MTFQVEEIGATDVTFNSNWLLDDSPLPQPIPGVAWFGGELTGI